MCCNHGNDPNVWCCCVSGGHFLAVRFSLQILGSHVLSRIKYTAPKVLVNLHSGVQADYEMTQFMLIGLNQRHQFESHLIRQSPISPVTVINCPIRESLEL